MALTDKKAELAEMLGRVKEFLVKSGHVKQYASGGERKETEKPKLTLYTPENVEQRSEDIKGIVDAIAKMDIGDIAVGVSEKNDNNEIFVADRLVAKTKSSEMVAAWQKELNEYNDKPGSLILIFDYDEYVRARANKLDLTLEGYLTQAMQKLAAETGRGKMMEEKSEVAKMVGDDVLEGALTNGAFSMSDDAQKVDGKRVRYSVIVPGDLNLNYVYEDAMVQVPGAKRLTKEMGITDYGLKSWSYHHEEGHSIDGPKVDTQETLKVMYIRGRMEKKADLNAAKKMWEEGTPEVAWYSMYWRSRNMYDAMYRNAYRNAVMEEEIPEAFDEKSAQIIEDIKAKEEAAGKKKHKKPAKIARFFAALDQNAETLDALSDMGMNVAYSTAPVVYKFMTKMRQDEEFRKKIMGMKAKEFDKWSSQFLNENDLSLSDFGNMIVAASSAQFEKDPATGAEYLVVPKDKGLSGFLALNQKINAMFKVTEAENKEYEADLKKRVNKYINKQLHMMGGFFFEDETFKKDNSAAQVAVIDYFDGFYKQIAKEAAKNGGHEAKAFDDLYVAEKNRLVAGNDPNKAVILQNLDRMKMNYQNETAVKITCFNGVVDMMANAETPDISALSGSDLVVAYLDTQMAKFDKAEQALRSNENIGMKDMRKLYENTYETAETVLAQEKLARTCVAKMLTDVEAFSLVGSSRILSDKVTAKAGGEFTGWVADFLSASAAGAPMYKMHGLADRIEEKKKLLATEVIGNPKLMTKIRETNPDLARRMEDASVSDGKTSAVFANNMARIKTLRKQR